MHMAGNHFFPPFIFLICGINAAIFNYVVIPTVSEWDM